MCRANRQWTKSLSTFALCTTLITSCGDEKQTDFISKNRGSTTITLSSTSTSTSTSPTTSASYFPTWVTNVPEDVYVAPFAQTVCDILRTWRPPVETSSEDVARLKKAESLLWDMILSGKSMTYSIISSSAAAALEYERKYPTDKRFPLSHALAEINCDNLGFTPFNSKYGIDPETGNTKHNP